MIDFVARSGRVRDVISFSLAIPLGFILVMFGDALDFSEREMYLLFIAVLPWYVAAMLTFRYAWRNSDMEWKYRGLKGEDPDAK